MVRPVAALRRVLRTRLRRQLRDVAPGRRLRLARARAVIERYGAGRPPLRVLDAGSEEGLLSLGLARRHPGWLLVAVDLAEEPLRRGRRWAREEGLAVHHVRGDLTRSLGVEVYDVVAAMESLVEIPDDRAALRSLVASLRPGGLFLAQVPTATWTPVLSGADRTWRREVRHGYDAAELGRLLAGLGLDVHELAPTFRRLTALAQDVRDRLKDRGLVVQLLLLPLMAAAVRLERAGIGWGPARAWFVVATRR
ncbi:class I SAM-dependent methyltransferase [Blastococcus sp. SYSU D00695]